MVYIKQKKKNKKTKKSLLIDSNTLSCCFGRTIPFVTLRGIGSVLNFLCHIRNSSQKSRCICMYVYVHFVKLKLIFSQCPEQCILVYCGRSSNNFCQISDGSGSCLGDFDEFLNKHTHRCMDVYRYVRMHVQFSSSLQLQVATAAGVYCNCGKYRFVG